MDAASINLVCPACGVKNRVLEARLDQAPSCGRCKAALLTASPLALEEAAFTRYIEGTELPVVVDFWADWCGPCKSMAPAFAEAARLRPRVRFAKLDTERAGSIAAQYGIRSIPTLIAFRGGREIERISGAMGSQQILSWIDRTLQS